MPKSPSGSAPHHGRLPFRRFVLLSAAVLLVFGITGSGASERTRDLTFEDRVRAQEAIERVAYSHRIGATRPFEQAMPRRVIEEKVRRSLKLSVALEKIWNAPVTAQMLHGEVRRLAERTRMPERLMEIQQALGNDPLLFEECYARPVLVERLARQFFANDAGWNDWWRDHEARFDETEAHQVARTASRVPFLMGRRAASTSSPSDCGGAWDAAPYPDARQAQTVVWTGTEMIVWGGVGPGNYLNSGGRYDPTTDAWSPTSNINAPVRRIDHTAVWTGTEMIVWGGYNTNVYLGSGARYNPSTDTWSPVSISGAPTGRHWHRAVWTGTRMIVWGGFGSGGYLNSGGRYDPATDTWAPTSSVNVPEKRYSHSAVWTGTQMIVWGGVDTGVYLNSGGRYDPATNSWSATSLADAPAGHFIHTAVWTGTQMIVWGGGGAASGYLASGGRYDPATDTWLSTSNANAPAGRRLHTAVWSGTEMIVWGGTSDGGFIGLDSGGRYDPTTDTWSPTSIANAATGRFSHTAVWTGTQMIVWGGRSTFSVYLDSGGRYDPGVDAWAAPVAQTDAPEGRSAHTAVWTGTEMIVWGGGDGDGFEPPLNSGGRYDPVADAWTPTSSTNAPAARVSHTAVWTGSHMIVWGGYGSGGYLNSGGRYDPATDIWAPTSSVNVPEKRLAHTAVWTGTEMIVWGGRGDAGHLDSGGRYDPATDTWSPTSNTNAPTGREGLTGVWTGTEMIVWGGGLGGGSYFDSGGRYDPAADTWTPTSMVNAPIERQSHAAVWTGMRMIVWAGYGTAGYLDSGGRYDPTTDTWSPTTSSDAPAARRWHTAVWSGTRLIAWGGQGAAGYLDDGGEYDPAADSWSPTALSRAPGGRIRHTAVWTGSQMFVWGGWATGPDFRSGGRYTPGWADLFGDLCDLNDGVILIRFADDSRVEWQPEAGVEAFNLYRGDLTVLRASGVSTQNPDTVPLAGRECGLFVPYAADDSTPAPGEGVFFLVTGIHLGLEGSLGQNSAGVERPNSHPCP